MTITINATRNEYTATSGQTTFNYTFKIFSSTAGEDLNVYQTPSGQDFDDSTDLITAYSITGAGDAAGGTIVLDTGATTGDRITIVSAIDEARTTDYQVNGDFDTTTVNNDFDRVVSLAKQQSEKLGRCLKLPESVQTSASLDLPTPTASNFIRWKADLTGLENVNLSTDSDATNAVSITYSNTTSRLTATDVQAAIDEIVAGGVEIGQNGFDIAGATSAGNVEIVNTNAALAIRPTTANGNSEKGGLTITVDASNGGCEGFELDITGNTSGEYSALSLLPTSGSINVSSSSSVISAGTVMSWTSVSATMGMPLKLKSYTVATVPSVAGTAGQIIYVSDATGASVTGSLCYSNGTSWIDVTTGIAVA